MQVATQPKIKGRDLDITKLAEEHYDSVYRFCARWAGRDLAADIAQETFITAQRTAGMYRGLSTPRTWLFGIAYNECRRALRKRRLDAPPIEIDLAAPLNTETQVIDRHALGQALAKLSPDHRAVVLLHEVEGLNYEEAAKVLGVPVGTVKSRLFHAFAHLRRSLDGGAA